MTPPYVGAADLPSPEVKLMVSSAEKHLCNNIWEPRTRRHFSNAITCLILCSFMLLTLLALCASTHAMARISSGIDTGALIMEVLIPLGLLIVTFVIMVKITEYVLWTTDALVYCHVCERLEARLPSEPGVEDEGGFLERNASEETLINQDFAHMV